METKYPLIEALGVEIHDNNGKSQRPWLYANDLEKVLSEATSVASSGDRNAWYTYGHAQETHSARIVCVRKIKRELLKLEKICAFAEGHRCYSTSGEEFGSKLAGKKFKITYEEIP